MVEKNLDQDRADAGLPGAERKRVPWVLAVSGVLLLVAAVFLAYRALRPRARTQLPSIPREQLMRSVIFEGPDGESAENDVPDADEPELPTPEVRTTGRGRRR